jgi:hypothetical protein
MPPYFGHGTMDFSHDRNSLYLSTGTQSGAGRCAALVVPQPVPRDARQASLPGMPQFVNPAPLVQMVTRSMKTTEPDRIEADPAKKE